MWHLERAWVLRSVSMLLSGHLTESMFRRYAIVDEADLAEGVAKLAANRNGSRSAETAVRGAARNSE